MTFLDNIEALAKAATPGPWYVNQDPRPGMEWNRSIASDPRMDNWVCTMMHGKDPSRDEATANFVAAANPAAVLAMVAVCRAAKHVAFSNGFDAALPEKQTALVAAIRALDSVEGQTND